MMTQKQQSIHARTEVWCRSILQKSRKCKSVRRPQKMQIKTLKTLSAEAVLNSNRISSTNTAWSSAFLVIFPLTHQYLSGT